MSSIDDNTLAKWRADVERAARVGDPGCTSWAENANDEIARLRAELAIAQAERLILARALLDEPAGRAEAFAIAKRVREEGT